MKCIMNTGTGVISRVSDREAGRRVDGLLFDFVPKHLWKAQDRVPIVEEPKPEKGEKERAPQKRRSRSNRRRSGKTPGGK